MSELEKMLKGEHFDGASAEIEALRSQAGRLKLEINQSLMKRSAMHCNVSCLVISVIKVAYSLLFTVSLAKPFVLAITPSST